MALAEELGNLSKLARHVGTFGSQLFRHGEESSPKISLIMEGKVAWALPPPGRPSAHLCQAAGRETMRESVLYFIITSRLIPITQGFDSPYFPIPDL